MSEKELTEPTLTDLVKEHKSLWNHWQGHDEAVKEFRKRHIERALSVVRRRTRPMSCFNNVQSIERIVYAAMSNLNDQWGISTLKDFAQKD